MLRSAMQGACGRKFGEQGQDPAILLHIRAHSVRNGRFARGTPANVRLNPCIPQGRESGKMGAGMLRGCCIWRCCTPPGANLVSKGKTLPYRSIFARIPSEMGLLPEAHHANVRLNPCIRKGANLRT